MVHGEANLSDSLTKPKAREQLEQFTRSGHKWRLMVDPEMKSAKKRKALGLKPLQDSNMAFQEWDFAWAPEVVGCTFESEYSDSENELSYHPFYEQTSLMQEALSNGGHSRKQFSGCVETTNTVCVCVSSDIDS